MSIRKQTALWTMANGNRIRLCDMTDVHLLNVIKMLRRGAREGHALCVSLAYSAASSLTGEMASFYADHEIHRLEETDPEESLFELPIFEKLLAEAERRKLKIE